MNNPLFQTTILNCDWFLSFYMLQQLLGTTKYSFEMVTSGLLRENPSKLYLFEHTLI